MNIPGTRSQQVRDLIFDASTTLTTGGTPQLLLPEAKSRSMLIIQAHGPTPVYVQIGAALATCTITGGKVSTTIVIVDGGFGYTYPPDVEFLGGGNSGQAGYLGVGQQGYPAPADPAYAAPHSMDLSAQRAAAGNAVISAGAVSSITVSDPGAGYQIAPYVRLSNSLRDPFGAGTPSVTQGFILTTQNPTLYFNGPACPTDPVSFVSPNTGVLVTVKWMP